jgi:hypothetical protein
MHHVKVAPVLHTNGTIGSSIGWPSVQKWDERLVEAVITLYQDIWTDRNTILHGTSCREAQQKL